MGLESQQFGPEALRRVPNNEEPRRSQETNAALTFPEVALRFTKQEADAYAGMVSATSLSELRAAIDRFNGVSTPRTASELGLSLSAMQIDSMPIGIRVHDLPHDAEVVATRSMHDGVLYFRIKDK